MTHATASDRPMETHLIAGDGLVFELRLQLSTARDGWVWTATPIDHDAFPPVSGKRAWANQRLALEDAEATLEGMLA